MRSHVGPAHVGPLSITIHTDGGDGDAHSVRGFSTADHAALVEAARRVDVGPAQLIEEIVTVYLAERRRDTRLPSQAATVTGASPIEGFEEW